MWTYKGEAIHSIEDMPAEVYGFVYRVRHLPSEKYYIGKKNVYSNRTLPPLKGQKRKRKITKESDWRRYYGSHESIKALLKEHRQEEFSREILEFCFSKLHLTYCEVKWICKEEALESEKYLNDNILGKIYKSALPKNS